MFALGNFVLGSIKPAVGNQDHLISGLAEPVTGMKSGEGRVLGFDMSGNKKTNF
jgi:hypothetical protein